MALPLQEREEVRQPTGTGESPQQPNQATGPAHEVDAALEDLGQSTSSSAHPWACQRGQLTHMATVHSWLGGL